MNTILKDTYKSVIDAENEEELNTLEESESSGDAEFYDTLQYKQDLKQISNDKSDPIQKLSDASMQKTANENECLSNKELPRAGKYHKRHAPAPPPVTSDSQEPTHIKATLVLKPGIVKPIGPPSEDSPKTVFVQSPKLRRRRLNQSPARSKPKVDSSISRFMMIPKKLNFWHSKGEGLKVPLEKRASWYEVIPVSKHLSLLQSKQLSKSDGNFAVKSVSGSPQSSQSTLAAEEDNN